MPSRRLLRIFVFLLASLTVNAQTPELSKAVQEFVRVNSGKTVLTHVRIIDGTGAAAVDDQNLVIENGKITAITKGADVAADKDTAVLDLRGHTVMPGLVGMHDHLFYIVRPNLDSRRHFDNPVLVTQMTFSAPRLYLASGVTTMRTTGSVEPYADLNLKSTSLFLQARTVANSSAKNPSTPIGFFDNGATWKLREVSAALTLPNMIAQHVRAHDV